MLKQFFLGFTLLLSAHFAFAIDCPNINKQAEKQAVPIVSHWGLVVQSKQRVYFHSAPLDACKIKGLCHVLQ